MFRKVVLPILEKTVGRRDLARGLRFVTNEVRRDTSNDMTTNGEAFLQAVVLKHARAGGLVLDVGANIGKWTESLLETAGELGVSPPVHCFEACSATLQTLRAAIGPRPGVEFHHAALSSHSGTLELHVVGDDVGINSLYAPRANAVRRTEKVVALTVDQFLADRDANVALLKIDTEGHDAEVLIGAKQSLQAGRIAVVQFEYNHRWIDARHYLRDVFDMLPTGYALGKLTAGAVEWYPDWHPELESFREGNYVIARPDAVGWFQRLQWWGPA